MFWPYVTWNLCKVLHWSKSVLTFDHCCPHSVTLGYYCTSFRYYVRGGWGAYHLHKPARVGISCINIKLQNLTWWETDPLVIYPNQLHTLKQYYISLPQIPSHIFWSFSHEMTQIIWFSNQNFWLFHVKGKSPCSYKFLVLTDCWIRHDHHDICVGCKDINECSKAWIPHLHALKMSMQFAGKDGYAQLQPSKAWK